MTVNVLIEAFGSIVNEELQSEDVDLEAVIEAGLDELSEIIDMDDVEKIYTGMNAEVTFALQDVVEASDHDVEVQAFYPNVNNIADEDDIEWNEAWKKGFTWRNNRLFVDDEDDDEQDLVDVCVRLGDAGNNGSALLGHARRKGVPALDINLDYLIDRDAAYGGGESEGTVPEPSEAQA